MFAVIFCATGIALAMALGAAVICLLTQSNVLNEIVLQTAFYVNIFMMIFYRLSLQSQKSNRWHVVF